MENDINFYNKILDRVINIISTVQRLESDLVYSSNDSQRAFTLVYDKNDFPVKIITRPIDGLDSRSLDSYNNVVKKAFKHETFKSDEVGIDIALHHLETKKKIILRKIQNFL